MAEQAGIAIEHISFSFRIASAFAEIGLLTGRSPLVVYMRKWRGNNLSSVAYR